jgi:maltooligosyltrehalose trehalohydrolase
VTAFTVWAPEAKSVAVAIDKERTPMASGEGGWWSADVPAAGPGTDYAFILDGSEPLPDPRSPWQPHGVHGPSRVVDHQAFP